MSLEPSIWKNWAGNQVCRARSTRPANVEATQRAVLAAREHGRIRCVGASACWSGLVPTDGTLIDMRSLDRVLSFDRSADPPTVRVEAGISMGRLVDFLAERGTMLRSPTVFREVSVGGAIATGSHGSGLGSGGLSDDVVAMTLITADGELHQIDARDGVIFHAAQVGLGALGAVVDVTLRLDWRSNILVEDRFLPRDRVIDGLADLVGSAPFVEMYWFPFADRMLVKSMSPIDEPLSARPPLASIKDALERTMTHVAGHTFLPLVSRNAPSLTRLLATLTPIFSSFTEGTRVDSSLDAFHYQRAYPRCQTMSFGVPLAHASLAFERVMELVEHDGRRGRYGLNMVAHARFLGESRALLSQSHGGPICDLELVTSLGVPHAAELYDAFTCAMYEIPGARPHWGKLIVQPSRIRSQFPALPAFLAARELLDPDRVFLNAFLEHQVFALPKRKEAPCVSH